MGIALLHTAVVEIGLSRWDIVAVFSTRFFFRVH